jgi:hypothetical protein
MRGCPVPLAIGHHSPLYLGSRGSIDFGCVQSVCHEVRVEREKSILKQGAVQHLYGRLAGTLRADAGDAALLVRPSG